MKATFPDGTVFEGTTEEFLAIRNQYLVPVNGHKSPAKTPNGASVWNEKKVRAFWDSLDVWNAGGRQKQLLRFLIKNGGRASEKEVWNQLGVKKGQELAGVLANLTRNARREARNDDVRAVAWALNDKHVWYYYIPEDILEFLKHFE
jgi:hypothetical protein